MSESSAHTSAGGSGLVPVTASPGGHYFISFSAGDAREFATYLYHALEAGSPHIRVWLDSDQLPLQSDRKWRPQIANAIDASAGLLFIATADSVVEQSVCDLEWTRALERQIPVLVLRLHEGVGLPFGLDGRQEVDFSRAYDPVTRSIDPREFRRPFSQLHRHFYWLASADNKLRGLTSRLAEARRALLRTTDQARRARIERDIADLREDISRQEPVARDPATAARDAQQRIGRELARERRQRRPVARAAGRRASRVRVPYPVPFTPPRHFGNRELETQLVGAFLQDETKRLLVVDGRGGLGKTALVCRVLESLRTGRLPDDGAPVKVDAVVYLCAIGTHRVTSPDLFAGIHDCIPDLPEQGLELLRDSTVGVRTRMLGLLDTAPAARIIVLLDNFETVVDPGTHNLGDENDDLHEALRALLDAPQHDVKVIITTQIVARDLLLVHPERQTTLSLTSGLPSPLAENILREMDGDGTLGLRDAPDALLNRARELTDGNPRALEALVGVLWADRDRTLSDILEDAAGTLPENVAQILIGYLFNRLALSDRQVMQALAIFGHPVTANAVDHLLEPYVPGVESVQTLKRLFNMRAVRKEAGSDRYYLHSIDRTFVLETVPVDEAMGRTAGSQPRFTRSVLYRRGADYFQKVRRPRDRWQSLDDVLPQLVEFDLLCAAEDYDAAAGVLLQIDHDYLSLWGLNSLVARMHERLHDRLSNARLRHDSVSRLAEAYLLLGRYSLAARRFAAAIALARELEDVLAEATASSALGYCHFYVGDFDLAIDEQKRAAAVAAAAGIRGLAASSVSLKANHVLAFSYSAVGETRLAVKHATRALSVARRLGDRREESMQLGYLGLFASYLGSTDEAVAHDNRALQLAREIGARREEAFHWGFLAEVRTQRGEHHETIRCANEALRIEHEIESSAVGSWNYQWLAVALCLTGDLRGAREAAEAACRIDEPLNNQNPQALLGVIALRQDDEAVARKAFATAVRQADALIDRCTRNWEALDAKGLAMCGLALCEDEGRLLDAVAAFDSARDITRDAGTVRRAVMQVDLLAPVDVGGRLIAARRAAAGE